MSILTVFNCRNSLDSWMNRVIEKWIISPKKDLEFVDSGDFHRVFNYPVIEKKIDAIDAIASFMKIADESDYYHEIEGVVLDLDMESFVEKANELYEVAFMYHYRDREEYYKSIWDIHFGCKSKLHNPNFKTYESLKEWIFSLILKYIQDEKASNVHFNIMIDALKFADTYAHETKEIYVNPKVYPLFTNISRMSKDMRYIMEEASAISGANASIKDLVFNIYRLLFREVILENYSELLGEWGK